VSDVKPLQVWDVRENEKAPWREAKVVNMRRDDVELQFLDMPTLPTMWVPGLKILKHSAWVRPDRKLKVVRVAGVRVDQLVTCPSCGKPMQLSESWKFNCKQCMRELTAEQALPPDQ
jgi:hypothetical protein